LLFIPIDIATTNYVYEKSGCHSIATLHLGIGHWLDRPVSSPDIIYSILLAAEALGSAVLVCLLHCAVNILCHIGDEIFLELLNSHMEADAALLACGL